MKQVHSSYLDQCSQENYNSVLERIWKRVISKLTINPLHFHDNEIGKIKPKTDT